MWFTKRLRARAVTRAPVFAPSTPSANLVLQIDGVATAGSTSTPTFPSPALGAAESSVPGHWKL